MATYDVVRPVGRTTTEQPARVLPGRCWGVDDVAAFLDVSVRSLYEWRRTGYGPRSRRVGRCLRYDPDEVRAWFLALDDPEAG